MSEWRAHVITDWTQPDHRRVVFSRYWGDGIQYISGFDERGMPVIEERLTSDVSRTGFEGLIIPIEALESLAEWLKPGPSQGELKRLEEALRVEQGRVDRLLTRALEALG